jgi:hypothetical protein
MEAIIMAKTVKPTKREADLEFSDISLLGAGNETPDN